MKRRFFIFIPMLTVFLAACSPQKESFVPEGYSLVWEDEFKTDGKPDPEKWAYSLGGGGWGNGELQKYTDSEENSFVKNGRLNIVAKKDGGTWTSARLKTQFLASWTYGYFEIKARLPKGTGTWPAIWMMPQSDRYGSWPRSGEIDIMEHVGFDRDRVHTTIHTQTYNHKKGTQKTRSEIIKGATAGFHVYALEWKEDSIEWFVDGKPFYKVERGENDGVSEWPFDKSFYLILNVAIGGSWGGMEGVDKNLKNAAMNVDYVRVYQK